MRESLYGFILPAQAGQGGKFGSRVGTAPHGLQKGRRGWLAAPSFRRSTWMKVYSLPPAPGPPPTGPCGPSLSCRRCHCRTPIRRSIGPTFPSSLRSRWSLTRSRTASRAAARSWSFNFPSPCFGRVLVSNPLNAGGGRILHGGGGSPAGPAQKSGARLTVPLASVPGCFLIHSCPRRATGP